jgi:hypothetical protein
MPKSGSSGDFQQYARSAIASAALAMRMASRRILDPGAESKRSERSALT